ncbi:MAG: ATP-dependent metallopeptidase FtsH/Yme1/Tma family protein [Clostridiales bacterium]|nr:ATP-dependent metallopeptidase FtsH/Yme1/Tma family protein [Clostridiales bacterium]
MARKFKGKFAGAALFAVVAAIILIFLMNEGKAEIIPYSIFLEMAYDGQVSEVVLSDDAQMKFKLIGEDDYLLTDNPRNATLKEELLLQGIPVSEGGFLAAGNASANLAGAALLCFILFMVYRASIKQPQKSMALSIANQAEASAHFLSFSDVAGNEEAKDSVADIIDFLKNPEKYAKYGARMPKGVIFYGPPGTGKTLMAKAIAGESGAPFHAVSGSDFVQMYVGVGAGRIRELFQKARQSGKAVIFIDEIDALGKKRAGAAMGGNDEREQTLNALLTEMSGFSSGEGIVVIAATNRLDTLDEALLRPGRFDRQVEIGLPDLSARKSILSLHRKNKPMSDKVDMDALSRQTVFFSGAMLENLLNEAAIFAAKRGADAIEPNDVDKAYYTIIAGGEKKDRSGIREAERRITAWHESGHALAAKLLSPETTVAKITIVPSSKGAGGFCVNIPPDKMYWTKQELEGQIMINFAGRAAEELTFGASNITTGASNDIEKSVSLAKDYVTRYGMGESLIHSEESEMKECQSLLDSLYQKTKAMLEANRRILDGIAQELLVKETLGEKELDLVIKAAGSPNVELRVLEKA